jgi:hypothetical protein
MGLLTKIKHKLSEVLSFDNKTGANIIDHNIAIGVIRQIGTSTVDERVNNVSNYRLISNDGNGDYSKAWFEIYDTGLGFGFGNSSTAGKFNLYIADGEFGIFETFGGFSSSKAFILDTSGFDFKKAIVASSTARYNSTPALADPLDFATVDYVDSNSSSYIQTGQTTTATPLILTTTNPSKLITDNSALSFVTRITGVSTIGDVWCKEYKGVVKRVLGNSSLVDITEESFGEDIALASLSASIDANNISDVVEIEVTGIIATTINWRAETVFNEVSLLA